MKKNKFAFRGGHPLLLQSSLRFREAGRTLNHA